MKKKNKLTTRATIVELDNDQAATVNGGSGAPLFGMAAPPSSQPSGSQPVFGLVVNPKKKHHHHKKPIFGIVI
jgi:hypothetical protein